MAMIKFRIYSICCLSGLVSCFAVGQEEAIPVAEPVEDANAPLQANPEADKLRIADMLFAQAQEAKQNPQEYRKMMSLSAQRYSEFVRDNPNSSQVPIALYRLATCMAESGQTADAYQVFAQIAQRYKGDVAAAAAYRLASEAYRVSNWTNAERFYQTVIKETTRKELKTDASYRLGRVYLAQKNTAKASDQFKSIIADNEASAEFRQASKMALGALLTETGKKDEAYALYKAMAQDTSLNVETRGKIMLQLAELASQLNKKDEAAAYYDELVKNPAMGGKTAETQLALLAGLVKQGKYKEALALYDQGQIQSPDKLFDARRRMIVGQACYELKDYTRAANLFAAAENNTLHSEQGMEAGYRKLLCLNELKDPNFVVIAQKFLSNYAKAYPTSSLPDMVRLMIAENLFSTNPQQATAFYDTINLDKVDPELKASIIYRSAWACSKTGNRQRTITLLDLFLKEFPQDERKPTALALRGDMCVQTGREQEALRDFDQVITTWPKNDAAALAWQKSAQIYYSRQDTINMIKCYEGLLKNFPETMPSALAEARFMIAVGYFDRKEFDKAVVNFSEARTLNPEKYASLADMRIILCYYQMQDAPNLKAALEALQKKDPKLLDGVPETIPAWLGMQAFSSKDYETADRYLTLATKNNELRKVKRLIWKNLAKARFYTKKYETALVAVDFYLKEEQQPYSRIEGQLDKAKILLGLGKYSDAAKEVEAALSAGIEGPLMAALKITQGDIAYAEKKYDEAAKQYATTAELFVSDRVLKPEALYKAQMALSKAGRVADAASYKAMLDKEFPGWKPSENQDLPQAGN